MGIPGNETGYNTSLVATVETKINWKFQNVRELDTPVSANVKKFKQTFSNGTGNNQANELFVDQRIVTAATVTDDIDLVGVLSNIFGRTVDFATIRFLMLVNRGIPDGTGGYTLTAGEDLLVGGSAATNPWLAPFNNDASAKPIVVDAGDELVLTNKLSGFAVTAGTADILRVVNNGTGDIAYDIVLGGTI